MKTALFLLLVSLAAHADEPIQMDNGMTCWRNASGVVYGCAGGVDNGSGGYNDVRTGERYQTINQQQAVDTRTGQVIQTPYTQNPQDGEGQ